MRKISVGLSDLVILGGAASLGLFVWDHARNEGRVLGKVKKFCNEVKQSVFNGDERGKVKPYRAFSEAERVNESQEKTSGVVGYLEACAKSAIQKLKILKTVFVLLFRVLQLIFKAVMSLKVNDKVGKGDGKKPDPKE